MKLNIEKVVKSIRVFSRRKYLFLKYKLNKNSGKLLIQKESDRQLGLTTMMIKDCVKNDYYLLVPNLQDKYIIFKVANALGYKVNVLIPSDILSNKLRGTRINVVVDNHCSFADIHELLCKSHINIVNGFVYEPLAR